MQALGGSCIGLWPAGPLGNQTVDDAIRHLGHSFRDAARLAADLGLTLAFEIEPPFVFHSEAHMRGILEAADEPLVKVIYDPSHFELDERLVGQAARNAQADRVSSGSATCNSTDSDGTLRDGTTTKHMPCGEGHVDIPASLAMLIEGGFNGWAMIDAWEAPDPYLAHIKGKEAIQAALWRPPDERGRGTVLIFAAAEVARSLQTSMLAATIALFSAAAFLLGGHHEVPVWRRVGLIAVVGCARPGQLLPRSAPIARSWISAKSI